jgi:CO/xanthine dehydrogenase Mo-binding subunit
MSPRVARSHVMGGVVRVIGTTSHEASKIDLRFGGFLNADFADCVALVNADIGSH